MPCKLSSYVCSVVIIPGACYWIWMCSWAQGDAWWEGVDSKSSKSEEENSCHQQKRKWLEWSQPTVSYEFLLPQALFPPSQKENKIKQDTCTLPHNQRGKQSPAGFCGDLGSLLPFSLVLSSHSQGTPTCREKGHWVRFGILFNCMGFWIHRA